LTYDNQKPFTQYGTATYLRVTPSAIETNGGQKYYKLSSFDLPSMDIKAMTGTKDQCLRECLDVPECTAVVVPKNMEAAGVTGDCWLKKFNPEQFDKHFEKKHDSTNTNTFLPLTRWPLES
jgi:hypothetical protein